MIRIEHNLATDLLILLPAAFSVAFPHIVVTGLSKRRTLFVASDDDLVDAIAWLRHRTEGEQCCYEQIRLWHAIAALETAHWQSDKLKTLKKSE